MTDQENLRHTILAGKAFGTFMFHSIQVGMTNEDMLALAASTLGDSEDPKTEFSDQQLANISNAIIACLAVAGPHLRSYQAIEILAAALASVLMTLDEQVPEFNAEKVAAEAVLRKFRKLKQILTPESGAVN